MLTTRFPSIAFHFALNRTISLPELSEDEGIYLLEKLVPQICQDYTDETRELVKSVGGLPLALTLLGRHLYVQTRNNSSQRQLKKLQNLCRNTYERFYLSQPRIPWKQMSELSTNPIISLHSTVAISKQFLPEKAQKALHSLAISFPSKPYSFTEEEALAICQCVSEKTLDILVDSGLLEYLPPDRYCLHPIIVDYEKLHHLPMYSANIS